MERERKVNVDKLGEKALEQLSKSIGNKVTNIVDDAVKEANRILKIYGMEAKMEIAISDIKQSVEQTD